MYFYMDMAFPTQNDVTDFGSIQMYYVGDPRLGYVNNGINVKFRCYTLLSKDIEKLDFITNACDGSQAFAVDTNKSYILCNNEWHEWSGNSSNIGTTIKWNKI